MLTAGLRLAQEIIQTFLKGAEQAEMIVIVAEVTTFLLRIHFCAEGNFSSTVVASQEVAEVSDNRTGRRVRRDVLMGSPGVER